MMLQQSPSPEEIAEALRTQSEQLRQISGSLDVPAPVWDKEILLIFGLSVLVFGLLTLVIVAALLRVATPPSIVLRNLTIPLIVTASVFLVTVGWSKEQISPVIGLFGTIAGYILGRTEPSERRSKSQGENA